MTRCQFYLETYLHHGYDFRAFVQTCALAPNKLKNAGYLLMNLKEKFESEGKKKIVSHSEINYVEKPY